MAQGPKGAKTTAAAKAHAAAPSTEDKEQLLGFYRQMLLIRRFEERAGQLYGMGLIGGFCHLYIGQEAIAVGMQSIKKDGDQIINHVRHPQWCRVHDRFLGSASAAHCASPVPHAAGRERDLHPLVPDHECQLAVGGPILLLLLLPRVRHLLRHAVAHGPRPVVRCQQQPILKDYDAGRAQP